MAGMTFVNWLLRRKNGPPSKTISVALAAHDYAVLVLSECDGLDRQTAYLHVDILQATILRAQFGEARLEAFLAWTRYEAYRQAYIARRQEINADFAAFACQPEILPGTLFLRGSRLIFWVKLNTTHRIAIDLLSGQVLVGDRRRMEPLRLRPTANLGLVELIGRCRLVDAWRVIRHTLILREGG